MKHSLLIVAGSASDGGAGIAADVRTATRFGVHPAIAVTCVTAQNTRGVQKVEGVDASVVKAQMRSCFDDLDVRAVKIGMVWSSEVVDAIAKNLPKKIPVVLDTVMTAQSDGSRLLMGDAEKRLWKLIRRADLVTPNVHEAEKLSGMKIVDVASAKKAAEKIRKEGARNVLVKGIRLKGKVVDVFVGKGGMVFGRKFVKTSTHGGGCVLSTAIAAGLANGRSLTDAVVAAEEFMNEAIRHTQVVGKGIRVVG